MINDNSASIQKIFDQFIEISGTNKKQQYRTWAKPPEPTKLTHDSPLTRLRHRTTIIPTQLLNCFSLVPQPTWLLSISSLRLEVDSRSMEGTACKATSSNVWYRLCSSVMSSDSMPFRFAKFSSMYFCLKSEHYCQKALMLKPHSWSQVMQPFISMSNKNITIPAKEEQNLIFNTTCLVRTYDNFVYQTVFIKKH